MTTASCLRSAPAAGWPPPSGSSADDVCELTVNRRQHEPWEIDALDQLRHGDLAAAWHAYRDHDRVIVADEPTVLHRQAVDDWWHTHAAGGHALLLAGTRAEVTALNRLARQRVADEGGLTGRPLAVGETEFRLGDRVLCTRNATVRTHDGQVADDRQRHARRRHRHRPQPRKSHRPHHRTGS